MKQRWLAGIFFLLVISLPAQATTAHTCRVYFQEADKFLKYISDREDLKNNMPEIKGNFEQNKKQISTASLSEQKKICENGMQELDNLNKMFGPKEKDSNKK